MMTMYVCSERPSLGVKALLWSLMIEPRGREAYCRLDRVECESHKPYEVEEGLAAGREGVLSRVLNEREVQ